VKKAEFFMAIIMLFVISGSSAAALAEIPVLPPAEEIVTHIVLEGVTETAAGDASFIPAPAVGSLPAGEDLECSSRIYHFGAWIIPQCNRH